MSGNLWQNKKGRTGKHRTKKIHDCIITSFFFLSEHNQQSWESCTGKFAFGNGRSYTFLDRIRKRVEQRVLVFLFCFALLRNMLGDFRFFALVRGGCFKTTNSLRSCARAWRRAASGGRGRFLEVWQSHRSFGRKKILKSDTVTHVFHEEE